MIQATDFVCPQCRAQVGKPCTDQSGGEHRATFHSERRRLAKEKRTRQAAPSSGKGGDK
jgi:hypothetical protein